QSDGSRIDHFLGFHRCWAVPGRAKTARKGKWILTPGRELFDAVKRSLGHIEIIAEDLGFVTAEAVALRDRLGYPGMRLMQCGFGDDDGCRFNQPHSYPRACVAYTGTHDNETTVGWAKRLKTESRRRRKKGEISEYERLLRYTGGTGQKVHWDLMRLGYYSSADTVIYPAQDVLGLDDRARMNVPAVPFGNWEWRMKPGSLTPTIARRLRALAEAYDRIRD
ncbi:MAG: 4-alpha-glucanotransferase, partial [Phycisphaerae bacterium]|nr:4-alpha-glucanotransferase [Phycisphaerae bacterium]